MSSQKELQRIQRTIRTLDVEVEELNHRHEMAKLDVKEAQDDVINVEQRLALAKEKRERWKGVLEALTPKDASDLPQSAE